MTREDIIRMAREVGGADITVNGFTTWVGTQSTEFLERFAALVAAAEREACAEMVDHILKEGGGTYGKAIRARGEQEEPR